MIEIVDDEEEIEEELEIEDIELDEDTEIEIIEDEEDFEEDTPFMIVENMPAFGPCLRMRGDERHQCTQMEIIKYVSSNTKYPPIAKDAGIQGTVFVYFVVGKNGKVRDVKVLREVDPRLDKEAVRVVESLPTFEPGQQRGKSVSVQYTIPVKFIIR
ncbi:MAG: energy transducer TonB [Flavobacteriales bacterium]|nr:energy transducer TonB [Flavobacteriales bacterium]